MCHKKYSIILTDRCLFNDLFCRMTWVSWHQKGQTNLKQEMMVWQWHSLDCKSFAPCSRQTRKHLITQFFTDWMLFLTLNQRCLCTEGNRMLICWFVNTSFEPQWSLLNKLLLFIHSLWQGVNLNQQLAVKTAYVCVHIIVHSCCALYSTLIIPFILQTVNHCSDVVLYIGWQWRNFFMSAVFRHFVGQPLWNVCYSDVCRRHFLNMIAIVRTFS